MQRKFFTSYNRGISESNVNELYNRILKQGFLPEVGTIDYVKDEKLKDSIIYDYTILKKDETKEWSPKNWKLEKKRVEYNPDIEVISDGQHKELACRLILLVTGQDIIKEENYRNVIIPDSMNFSQYVEAKNSGRGWTRKDADIQELPTGNENLDKIIRIANEEKLDSQVLIDWGTIGLPNVTSVMLKDFRAGIKECKFQIFPKHIEESKSILNALKGNVFLSKSIYNNHRFSKGIKQFANEFGVDKVIEVINKIDKEIWEESFIPEQGASAEAKFYRDAFSNLKTE